MSEREDSGLPEEEFEGVMAGLDKAAPLLRAFSGKGEGGAPSSDRQALLHALRPYLSPARREAAEYLLRLWRIGAVIKNMTKEE